ncbi:hypothetical protein ANO14919_017690 [Xylariales sp. No.14919]|nr:hypothetical protein ANO14919_017690 [Xylariales sp. No.14919]
MHCEQGLPDRPLPADISPDGTHPFDHGYGLMADIFFSAFVDADRRGSLNPEANGIPGDGELEGADDPFIFESEPPEKRANPPKDENKVPPKPAPEVVPRAM